MQVNVYVDISMLGQLLICLNAYFISLKLNHLKQSKIRSFLVGVLSVFSLTILYFFEMKFLFVSIFFISLILTKHRKILISLCYLVLCMLMSILASLLGDIFIVYRGIVFIHKIEHIICYGLFPIVMFFIYLFLSKVTTFFKVKRYVYHALLKTKEKYVKIKAFYDTGNTLLYKGYPVVFLKSKKVINLGGFSSFDKYNNRTYFKGIITIKNKKKTVIKEVMVSMVSEKENFFGCDCLLNSNLF